LSITYSPVSFSFFLILLLYIAWVLKELSDMQGSEVNYWQRSLLLHDLVQKLD